MDWIKLRREFSKLLASVQVGEICEEEYTRTYLQHLLAHKEYYLSIYAQVLSEIHNRVGNIEEPICLADYGCGNGLLGIFARYSGFTPVIFQDSNPDFLNAARKLSEHLKVSDVHFVPGEIDNLRSQPFRIDAIAGTDVIEHIYDLDIFFSEVKRLNAEMVTVFTTAANPFNPILVSRLKTLQKRDEFVGNDGKSGKLSGDSHLPYLEMRKQLISKNFPGEKNNDALARATRGLAGSSINIAVKQYQLTNRLPVPSHPTNTCNPITGSWTERILTASQYRLLYNRHGYNLDLSTGFYNQYKRGLGAIIGRILNAALPLVGKTFSPFIILTGYKNNYFHTVQFNRLSNIL